MGQLRHGDPDIRVPVTDADLVEAVALEEAMGLVLARAVAMAEALVGRELILLMGDGMDPPTMPLTRLPIT